MIRESARRLAKVNEERRDWAKAIEAIDRTVVNHPWSPALLANHLAKLSECVDERFVKQSNAFSKFRLASKVCATFARPSFQAMAFLRNMNIVVRFFCEINAF